jgi:hypothetical protein
MAKYNKDIYGADPDGGAKDAAADALRRMGSLSVTDEAEKSDGPDTSSSRDITGNLGSPKP